MKKPTTTNRNLANWHAKNLRKRTKRAFAKFVLRRTENDFAAKSARKIKKEQYDEQVFALNKRVMEEVGLNPAYMSSSEYNRKYPFLDRPAAIESYYRDLAVFKKKLERERDDMVSKLFPKQNAIEAT